LAIRKDDEKRMGDSCLGDEGGRYETNVGRINTCSSGNKRLYSYWEPYSSVLQREYELVRGLFSLKRRAGN
jgi:hypothetical protein